MKNLIGLMTLLLAVLQFPIGRAHAAATFWKPFGFDSWATPANWDPVLPAAGWDAIINNGTARVGFDPGVAQDIFIGADPAFSTGALFIDVAGCSLGCAPTLTSRNTYIGYSGSFSGRVLAQHNGAKWTNTGELVVGYHSTGTTTLEVYLGARVSNGRGIIGHVAGTTGIATIGYADDVLVDDAGWSNSGDLIVGNAGNGTLNIINGGDVTNTFGRIGAQSGSVGTVKVDGIGSQWLNSANLTIGNAGIGNLEVVNGGIVTSATSYLGFGPTSTGTVTVIGTGSTWTSSGTLYVGNQSTAQSHLNIQEGAVVSSSGGRIGWEAGASGRVTVGNLGRWNTGQISVGNLGVGVLNVYNSGFVSANDGVYVFPASSVMGDATIQGNIYSDGHTRPGAGPPGRLFISGDYSQSHLGTLHIDISSSGYDKLNVDGDLSLAGTLSLEFPLFFPVWFPAFGDTFNVLDWTGSLTGTFDTLQLPALPAMRRWKTSQLYTTGVISIDLLPTGDYSKDGTVDAADYVLWRKTLGQTGFNLAADGNGDRKIDAADFDLWRAHFGETFGSGATADAPSGNVPEPASATFLLIAAVSLAVNRRFGLRNRTTTRSRSAAPSCRRSGTGSICR
jgi:T5SS/PEP-CTERM-associated repeat protein